MIKTVSINVNVIRGVLVTLDIISYIQIICFVNGNIARELAIILGFLRMRDIIIKPDIYAF